MKVGSGVEQTMPCDGTPCLLSNFALSGKHFTMGNGFYGNKTKFTCYCENLSVR